MKELNIAKNIKSNPKKFWQYAQSKLKSKVGVCDFDIVDDKGKRLPLSSTMSKSHTPTFDFSFDWAYCQKD